jgi:hypothetical protein
MAVSDRMRKRESAVMPATEMRNVKAVASAMEMASTMAAMTTASMTTASVTTASAQRGAR